MSGKFLGLAGRRVLIVEDEVLVAMSVEDLLMDEGCVVLPSASTVAQAMVGIEQDQPDIVVLDRNLDGDRTTSVAEKLNGLGIPYLVLTGYVEGVADEPAMADAPCLQKPWNSQVLLETLNQMVN